MVEEMELTESGEHCISGADFEVSCLGNTYPSGLQVFISVVGCHCLSEVLIVQ